MCLGKPAVAGSLPVIVDVESYIRRSYKAAVFMYITQFHAIKDATYDCNHRDTWESISGQFVYDVSILIIHNNGGRG